MDQVELAFGGRVVGRIVGAHLDLRAGPVRCGLGPGHVDVGGQHVTLRAHPCGQPPDDRVAAGPHLPAAPAGGDAELLHVGEGRRVEELGERGEPLGGGLLGVGQQVAVVAHPAAGYRAGRSGQGAAGSGRWRRGAGPGYGDGDAGWRRGHRIGRVGVGVGSVGVGAGSGSGARRGGGRCGVRSCDVPA